jgi:mannose-6-phosphate isomerase
MERMECPIRGYAWGSRTVIAGIQGRPVPTDEPEAELWVGAHPAAPSTLAGVPLPDRIAVDPDGMLGEVVRGRFGPRLPYLMKLLAAEAPLSLQVHPDAQQAEAGYAAERAAGVPVDAPHRRYVDPYHKPELLVAVSEFRALCGFRDPAVSAEVLAGLGVSDLAPAVAALRVGDLATAVTGLLAGGSATAAGPGAQVVAQVVAAAGGRGGMYEVVGELAKACPGDPGVVVALLLNQVTLAPGEAVFMPAGNLHSYLQGVGVEVMAASDNVVRGGLTSKHVDPAELLRVLRCEALSDPVRLPVPVSPGVVTWPVPVSDFSLYRAIVGASVPRAEVPVRGPSAVLCLAGNVSVDDGVAVVTLSGGEAAFGAGGSVGSAGRWAMRRMMVSGTGQVFVAATG